NLWSGRLGLSSRLQGDCREGHGGNPHHSQRAASDFRRTEGANRWRKQPAEARWEAIRATPVLGGVFPRWYAEGRENLSDVPLHAVDADAELASDLGVRAALRQQVEHLPLARCPGVRSRR